MAVSDRHCTAHMAHGVVTTGDGMDCPSNNNKRDHQQTVHSPDRDLVEGGGGSDRHPSTFKPPSE